MGNKGLLILKLTAAALTFGATTVSAIVVYKDPNKISDIIKEVVTTLKN